MHLMKLCFNVSALKGREKIILSCLCVNCICCVAYGANALGLVRIYMDAHGRRFLPTRFLEWICATPLLVLLIANLSDFLFRAESVTHAHSGDMRAIAVAGVAHVAFLMFFSFCTRFFLLCAHFPFSAKI